MVQMHTLLKERTHRPHPLLWEDTRYRTFEVLTYKKILIVIIDCNQIYQNYRKNKFTHL